MSSQVTQVSHNYSLSNSKKPEELQYSNSSSSHPTCALPLRHRPLSQSKASFYMLHNSGRSSRMVTSAVSFGWHWCSCITCCFKEEYTHPSIAHTAESTWSSLKEQHGFLQVTSKTSSLHVAHQDQLKLSFRCHIPARKGKATCQAPSASSQKADIYKQHTEEAATCWALCH